MGLPEIKAFFESLRIKTASRASFSKQNWASYLSSFYFKNNIRFVCIKKPDIPLFKSFSESLNLFNKQFYNHPDRMWSCNIFFSSLVQYNNFPIILRNTYENNDRLVNLRVKDVINTDTRTSLSYGQFLTLINENISYNLYFQVINACKFLVLKVNSQNLHPRDFSIKFVYDKKLKTSQLRKYLVEESFNIVEYSSYITMDNIFQSPFSSRQSKLFFTTH